MGAKQPYISLTKAPLNVWQWSSIPNDRRCDKISVIQQQIASGKHKCISLTKAPLNVEICVIVKPTPMMKDSVYRCVCGCVGVRERNIIMYIKKTFKIRYSVHGKTFKIRYNVHVHYNGFWMFWFSLCASIGMQPMWFSPAALVYLSWYSICLNTVV